MARLAPAVRPVARPGVEQRGALVGLTPGGWRIAPVTAAGVGRAIARGAFDNNGVVAYPPQYAGYDEYDDFEGLGGISIKGITKGIKRIASPIQKGLAAVGHTVGNVVTSKVGQGILGGALAFTGVGIPAAAGIFAATKGVGNLIKPGGNLKHALTGAGQGAIEGVVSVGAGRAVRTLASKIANRGGAPTPTAGTATDIAGQLAKTGVQVMTNRNAPSPYDSPTAGLQADAASIASGNAQDAAIAARVAGQQLADITAALEQAKARADAQAVAILQAQQAEARRQATAAQQSATSANAVSGAVQAGVDSVGQLQQLLNASAANSNAAQMAAAAPATPAGTAAVTGAADAATDAAGDALTDTAPEEAGILSHPGLLLGGLVVLALMTKPKRRRHP